MDTIGFTLNEEEKDEEDEGKDRILEDVEFLLLALILL